MFGAHVLAVPAALIGTHVVETLTFFCMFVQSAVAEVLITVLALEVNFFNGLFDFVIDFVFAPKVAITCWTPIFIPLKPVSDTLLAEELFTVIAAGALYHIKTQNFKADAALIFVKLVSGHVQHCL